MINCWNCGRDNEPFFKFCLSCGAELDQGPGEATRADVAAAAAADTIVQKVSAKTEPDLEAAPPAEGDAPPVPELIRVKPDQTEAERFRLHSGDNTIGREGADIAFPNDRFLEDLQASILAGDDGQFVVEPADTRNGTFVRLSSELSLDDGIELRIGQQLLRIERFDAGAPKAHAGPSGETTVGSPRGEDVWGRAVVMLGDDEVLEAFLLRGSEVRIGREEGDITFPHDPFVSGSHAKIVRDDDGRASLTDTGSRNGTFVRIHGSQPLESGDFLLAGQQLLRLSA